MKRVIIILAIIASFAAGVAGHFLYATYRLRTKEVPARAQDSSTCRCPSARDVIATGRYVVVSMPNEHDFYIGKTKLTLTDISDRIRQSIGDLPVEQRTVFVKGEPAVRYETLSAVMHAIRDADVDRIEVVPIPKKPLQ